MEILVFKTDIESENKINSLKSLLNNKPEIQDWSVDIEDIDNVLRIEANHEIEENNIIQLIKSSGFQCETLPD